ncbi:hypothetical protein PTW37_03460 [Arthrobacter agilis]|nr:hypothetical protein [Arthrobacter agilis]WDF33997.1 hypothetical protein PTW37_03460 [Arthrobacter agilis]
MTSDEDLDPPVPSFLEGVTVNRVHDGKILEEQDDDGAASTGEPDSAS